MVGEAFRAQPLLLPVKLLGERPNPPHRILPRPAPGAPAVGLVVRSALGVDHRHVSILLEVGERALGRVDRDVGEVRSAQTLQLGVEIREVTPLQEWVVAEVDARRDVLSAEGDLFGLGEEVVWHPIEHQSSNHANRQHLFGNDLGGVQHVEVELVGEGLVEQLQAQLPFGKGARMDRVPQVAPMEVRIGAVDLHSLVPGHGLQAKLRLPVEFDEG